MKEFNLFGIFQVGFCQLFGSVVFGLESVFVSMCINLSMRLRVGIDC